MLAAPESKRKAVSAPGHTAPWATPESWPELYRTCVPAESRIIDLMPMTFITPLSAQIAV